MKTKSKTLLSILALTASLYSSSFSQSKAPKDSINKKVELFTGSVGKMLNYGDFSADFLIQKPNSFTFGGMISNVSYNDPYFFSKFLNLSATAGYWSNRDARLRLFSSDAGTVSLGWHAYGGVGPSVIYKIKKHEDEVYPPLFSSHIRLLAGADIYSSGNNATDKLSELIAEKHAYPPISLYISGSVLYQPPNLYEGNKKTRVCKLKEFGGQLGLRIWIQK